MLLTSFLHPGPRWSSHRSCRHPLRLYSMMLLESAAQQGSSEAKPSNSIWPSCSQERFIPINTEPSVPPPYRVALRTVCPAGLAKFVPSQHTGQDFRGWVWVLSSQNLERRAQQKVGARGKADWCLSSLQGRTDEPSGLNARSHCPEVILIHCHLYRGD